MRKLNLNDIKDQYTRENFKALQDDAVDNVFRSGNFRFVTLAITVGTIAYSHGLDFIPRDVVVLSVVPSNGTQCDIKVHYGAINNETITISSTITASARLFVGSYRGADR